VAVGAAEICAEASAEVGAEVSAVLLASWSVPVRSEVALDANLAHVDVAHKARVAVGAAVTHFAVVTVSLAGRA
jgi:hypothetical protein